jgi:hypothetical protein
LTKAGSARKESKNLSHELLTLLLRLWSKGTGKAVDVGTEVLVMSVVAGVVPLLGTVGVAAFGGLVGTGALDDVDVIARRSRSCGGSGEGAVSNMIPAASLDMMPAASLDMIPAAGAAAPTFENLRRSARDGPAWDGQKDGSQGGRLVK